MNIFDYKKTPSKNFLLMSSVDDAVLFYIQSGKIFGENSHGDIIFKQKLPEIPKKSLYLIELSRDGSIFRETKIKI